MHGLEDGIAVPGMGVAAVRATEVIPICNFSCPCPYPPHPHFLCPGPLTLQRAEPVLQTLHLQPWDLFA